MNSELKQIIIGVVIFSLIVAWIMSKTDNSPNYADDSFERDTSYIYK
jgi:hypothetical protein